MVADVTSNKGNRDMN